MGDRRNNLAYVFFDVDNEQQKPRGEMFSRIRHSEKFFGPVSQHGRRERAEWFSELDLRIDDILHIRPPRIRQNTAVAQRAWPPFKPSLRPADNFPFLKPVNRVGDQLFFIFYGPVRYAVLFKKTLTFARALLLAPVTVFHNEASRFAKHGVVSI